MGIITFHTGCITYYLHWKLARLHFQKAWLSDEKRTYPVLYSCTDEWYNSLSKTIIFIRTEKDEAFRRFTENK